MATSLSPQRYAPKETGWLDRTFHLTEKKTSLGIEIEAGMTTFMVMSYIIFVNPLILGFVGTPELQASGLPFAATMSATCLAAGVFSIAMGLLTNYPFALAAGMGLNAVVSFQLVAGMKLTWPEAMGVVFLEGLIITVLVLTGLRQAIMDAIPMALKQAIGVGIGLFILFIGLVNANFVQTGTGTVVALGKLTTVPVLVAVVGLFLTIGLLATGMRAALLVGILGSTLVATVLNYASGLTAYTTPGWAVLPTQLVALPDFSTLFKIDPLGAFVKLGFISAALAIFTIMLSDFFDTMGTITGISTEAGFMDEEGRLPRLNRVLLVDSLGAMFGGAASASSNTTYVESAAGVSAGGRTGITAIVVGCLFLLALFLNPLVGMVPKEATAPALIVVGFYMVTLVRNIEFDNFDEGLPAVLTIAGMPMTWSITNGIGAGFITYTFIALVRGRATQIHPLMYAASVAFVVHFGTDWLRATFGI